jgi:hypothetical protein
VLRRFARENGLARLRDEVDALVEHATADARP